MSFLRCRQFSLVYATCYVAKHVRVFLAHRSLSLSLSLSFSDRATSWRDKKTFGDHGSQSSRTTVKIVPKEIARARASRFLSIEGEGARHACESATAKTIE